MAIVRCMITETHTKERRPHARYHGPKIEVVVPVYNEAHVLEASILRLHGFLRASMPFAWRIVIADNASTDDTWRIARRLRFELDGVEALRLSEKGRGRALRAAWSTSDADILCYMDVDLSTDLTALLPLVAGLASGHSDVAIGTRLAPGARTVRSRKRELISRVYNGLLHVVLRSRFSDAQCGFKAVSADVAQTLLPEIEDDGWSSTPSCSCSPSAAACGSTRWRWTGWRTPIRGSTSSPPHGPICAAWRAWR